MRKIIQTIASVVLAILFVAGGVVLAKKLAGSKPALPKSTQGGAATVYTKVVENGSVPIKVNATGQLLALNRVDLFSEVQGVMLPDQGRFKAGNRFSKGTPLLAINAEDFRANLVSQRSNLLNLITSSLADLRLDFPNSFEKWNDYAKALDINKTLAPLPEPSSDQEKLFISGRQILSNYYSIKNAEIILNKYNLSAPFDGVLTEAMVTPGTVIRPGQKLGSFIDPTVFELEAPVNATMIEHLKVGQSVSLQATDKSGRSWTGKIVRINSLLNPATQTMNAYIQVSGKGLEEGMFLEAVVAAKEVDDAFELPREVLFDEDQVYTTDGKQLVKSTTEPVYFTEKTVIVRGLQDGTKVLVKMPPSAYAGMEVIISED
jgi:multidrug efflux pump subunit AcrA (membrane-fusion protein)